LKSLIFALGLLFAIEGLLYALAPNMMKRMAAMVLSVTSEALRQNGIFVACLGAILIYIAARFLH
jgi:Uncharacterized protein conserved in bacteria